MVVAALILSPSVTAHFPDCKYNNKQDLIGSIKVLDRTLEISLIIQILDFT